MIIIPETPQEERLLEKIKHISNNMVSQNNRATMMPMWTIIDNGNAGEDYGAVMFFTQEEAERHLEENAHHYRRPQIYVRSAHDNSELRAVVHLLFLAGNNQLVDNHYKGVR